MSQCCTKPAIANMDHFKGSSADSRKMLNRCCTRCWTHWYGEGTAVKEYSKKEWDHWISQAFAEAA